MRWPAARSAVRGWPVAAVLAVAGLLFGLLGAGPAAAQDSDSAPQSERLAAALRVNPVYITDQLPRRVPRSTAPEFAAQARRMPVPTYVLLLPDQNLGSDTLLGTVHDRLGRDGLYVLIGTLGVADARAFGVTAPAEDATAIALYALPYDAGPLRSFQEFTDAIVSGPRKAAARAEQLRKKYGGSDREVHAFYPDPVDRENQGFVTGMALLGVPLSVLLLGWFVRRRLTAGPLPDRPVQLTKSAGGKAPTGKPPAGRKSGSAKGTSAAAGKGLAGGAPSGAAPGRRFGRGLLRRPELGAAVLLAVLIGVGAPQLFDQTRDSAAAPPTKADLTARVDRVAAGLRQAPVYTDPESPNPLDAAGLAGLERRIAAFTPGPVRIAVVPQLSDDESGGDSEVFVTALHQRLGKDGVYVIADPMTGIIDAFDYGLRLKDGFSYSLPTAISYDDPSDTAADHRLGERLDQLMTYFDGVPKADTPAQGPDRPAPPVDDNRLPGLYHGDFWPGLLVGALGAGLLLGLTALCWVTGAVVRRRRHAPVRTPVRPSAAYLQRTARQEVEALSGAFSQPSADPAAPSRTRVWNCLDAAVLLSSPQDASPADLTAALVLARAGRAALAGGDYRFVCEINPLHGPAATSPPPPRSGRRPGGSGSGRRHLCAACRVTPHPLTLPAPDGSRIPYEQAGGPLPAITAGIDRLIERTREYASVQ